MRRMFVSTHSIEQRAVETGRRMRLTTRYDDDDEDDNDNDDADADIIISCCGAVAHKHSTHLESAAIVPPTPFHMH